MSGLPGARRAATITIRSAVESSFCSTSCPLSAQGYPGTGGCTRVMREWIYLMTATTSVTTDAASVNAASMTSVRVGA